MSTLSAVFFYIVIPIGFGALWALILKPDRCFHSILIGLAIIFTGITNLYMQLQNDSFLSFGNAMTSSGFVAAFGWGLLAQGIVTFRRQKKQSLTHHSSGTPNGAP